MTDRLCDTWKAFLNGQELGVEERDALIAHVGECDACRKHRVDDPKRAYELLAGVDESLGAEDEAIIVAMDDSWTVAAGAVERAVTDTLLPNVRKPLADRARRLLDGKGELTPLKLFESLEAISLMLHQHPSPAKRFVLDADAGLLIAGQQDLTAALVVEEIEDFTLLPRPLVRDVVGWIIEAARSYPHLILGAEASPVPGTSGVELRLVDRDPHADLEKLWRPTERAHAAH